MPSTEGGRISRNLRRTASKANSNASTTTPQTQRARDGSANEARSNLANYVRERLPVLSARPDHQLAASRPFRGAATRHRKRQRDTAHSELEELRSRKLRDFRLWVSSRATTPARGPL